MARTELPNGVILPAEYSDDWYDDMTSNLSKLDDVIGSDADKLSAENVGAAALSNDYADLDNKPTIPTKTSDLTNDSNFVDTSNPAVSSGITSAKVTDYDTHIADTDIHVTASDKTTWNAVTSKANDSDVVHKSGNETVSGNKTFSGNVNIYNSDATATTPGLYLKSSKIEISSQGNTSGDQNLTYLDKNSTAYAFVKGAIQSNGSAVKIRATAKDSSDNSVINELQLFVNTNGNKAIFPLYSNEVDLGISNYKWKSLNGVEPSSLSLPDLNNGIDISGYFTTLGTSSNNYTPPANGWICIKGVSTLGSAGIYVESTKGFYASAGNFIGIGSNLRFVNLSFPVVKGEQYTIVLKTIDTSITAKFFPCQGNV